MIKNGIILLQKLSALLRGIMSNHVGSLYCLNCIYSFSTENTLKNHENVCISHDYCYTEIPKEDKRY